MVNFSRKDLVYVGLILILTIVIAILVFTKNNIVKSFTLPSQQPAGTYDLINPSVTSNLNKHYIINFTPLKNTLTDIQKKYNQQTYIYFAYLNNNAWIGLNEKDKFTAASTIKVPLAMAVYKAVEEGKIKLSDLYSLDELDLDQNFGDLYKAGPDKSFTVEELLKIMLENSDNTAMRAIITALERIGINDPFSDVYSFMGWELVTDLGATPNYNEINLKTLANMFISLYNAQYVNTANSQAILTFLSNSPFNDKIVAGVPKDIKVAHKIGMYDTNLTYSDCGIVYAPSRNYLLCLGSSGTSEKIASKFMSEISKATYDYVINN